MKERAILFSAPMVRALLAGKKTQTRRMVKIGSWPSHVSVGLFSPAPEINVPQIFGAMMSNAWTQADQLVACPYGQPGDRLWVQETHAYAKQHEGQRNLVQYRANGEIVVTLNGVRRMVWRPSIFMPRWASRIQLAITGVRVERLNSISKADALAEGIEPITDNSPFGHPDCWKDYLNPTSLPFDHDKPVASYRSLWDSINGKGSWAENPWVWVVEFRRVEA